MKQINWKNGIYYGEVFGFLVAWAVCLAVAFSQAEDVPAKQGTESIAAASGDGGMLE